MGVVAGDDHSVDGVVFEEVVKRCGEGLPQGWGGGEVGGGGGGRNEGREKMVTTLSLSLSLSLLG